MMLQGVRFSSMCGSFEEHKFGWSRLNFERGQQVLIRVQVLDNQVYKEIRSGWNLKQWKFKTILDKRNHCESSESLYVLMNK